MGEVWMARKGSKRWASRMRWASASKLQARPRSSSLANATPPSEPFLGVWQLSHYATACCGQKANAGVLSSLNAALGIAFAARSGRNLRMDRTLLQLAHGLYQNRACCRRHYAERMDGPLTPATVQSPFASFSSSIGNLSDGHYPNVPITENKGRLDGFGPGRENPGSRRRGLSRHGCGGAWWSGETGRRLRPVSYTHLRAHE